MSDIIEKDFTIFVLFTAECLANFLCGEGRLENFLEQTPAIDANISKARNGLVETRKYLLLAANEKDKQVLQRDIMSDIADMKRIYKSSAFNICN